MGFYSGSHSTIFLKRQWSYKNKTKQNQKKNKKKQNKEKETNKKKRKKERTLNILKD